VVVVWTFFLRVGVLIGLVGVRVEGISSGRIRTRHWTGEEGAAVVVAGEECPGGNLKGVLVGKACPYFGEPFSIRASVYSFTARYLF
jgi:hypothetical protein